MLAIAISEVGKIWLLALAFRSRSKRLGAYFTEILNALFWYLDFVDIGNILSWLTLVGPGVSAYALTFSEIANALCWYLDVFVSA